ncbi:MAG TPA: EamA family transporter [Nitrososphaeraceae archaeon]|nr:EamA family transporter [Nitrososphaeraceae archaeon]
MRSWPSYPTTAHPLAREHITKQQWKDSLVLGLTLFVGGQGLLTWGAQYLSSGITGLLNSTIPLWVAIIGYLIYKKRRKGGLGQRLTRSTIIGLSAGFGGLMLLVAPSIGNGDLSPVGTAALIGSSIAWAIGSIYSSKATSSQHSCIFWYDNDNRRFNVNCCKFRSWRISQSRFIADLWMIHGCTDIFDSNHYCSGIYRLLLAS